MKILVCIKQVPESDIGVRVDESGRSLVYDIEPRGAMNRFDEFAVEEALLVRETMPISGTDAITVGPVECAATVRRALGMGLEHGIHIVVQERRSIGPFEIASWISSVARDRAYDLILAGVMSEDLMQGQVGPMVAEMLSLPCATSVISQRIDRERKTVRVEREISGGFRDVSEMDLPAVLTVQSGINKPRYPSLSNVLRAKQQTLETLYSQDLPRVESREQIAGMNYPEKTIHGEILQGTSREKAIRLLSILEENSLVQ